MHQMHHHTVSKPKSAAARIWEEQSLGGPLEQYDTVRAVNNDSIMLIRPQHTLKNKLLVSTAAPTRGALIPLYNPGTPS
jgi:hypothetical protein